MRTNAIRRNRYSADYWNFIDKTVGDELVTEYFFVKNIRFIMGSNPGERTKIYSQYPLRVGSRIRGIVDAAGNDVAKEYFFQVATINPVFNAFGQIDNYECSTVKAPLDQF